MKTPIDDFIKEYARSRPARLHVPGHKGRVFSDEESADITEITGADSLYEAKGIIAESEKNASDLFGCPTFYSAEGSSLCIKAGAYLLCRYAKSHNLPSVFAAARNAHKSFIAASALLGFDIKWFYGKNSRSYMESAVNAEELDLFFKNADIKPAAFYLTSPDYLGNVADIKGISEVCRKHGILLFVDAAHGAYLKFLEKSLFPIDLGADMCCTSAHKTLPALTGAAYMHISASAPKDFCQNAKDALALFGSTSPSYLILRSLDRLNAELARGYEEKLSEFIVKVENLKNKIRALGYTERAKEPLKITLEAKKYGYTGEEIAEMLRRENVVCEFADKDFTVMMFSPQNDEEDLTRLYNALSRIPKKQSLTLCPPELGKPQKVFSPKDVFLLPTENIPVQNSEGRIFAEFNFACPPAVPVVVCGEIIDGSAVQNFIYYGKTHCKVVKQD